MRHLFSYVFNLFFIDCRHEDEQEDYEETVPLHLAEQEEEDLNRIKEESRRRRQAILEKYKSQQSQQKTEPQSGDAEKGVAIFPFKVLVGIFFFEFEPET